MLTADTITDWLIRAERDRIFVLRQSGSDTKEDREIHAMCESALNEMCHPSRRREARARCAEIINARGAKP